MARDRLAGPLITTAMALLSIVLAPSIVRAQDEARIDTGWDIIVLDLGSSLKDPVALGRIVSKIALESVGSQEDPERAPDGGRVAYTSLDGDEDGRSIAQVHVLEPDGTERRITRRPGGAADPTWSPDGDQLAFVGRGGAIATIDLDGTHERTLVRSGAARPDWSPDGRTIAFQRGDEDGGEIWTANVRTGKLLQLTQSERSPKRCRRPGPPDPEAWAHLPVCEFLSSDPSWSPDGSRIAFLRHEDLPGGYLELEDTDLWLMRSDGSRKRRAVAGEGEPYAFPGVGSPDGHFQGAPTWSPDGRWIAITGGHCDCILFVDVATGTSRRLEFPGLARMRKEIDWGPDGTILGTWAEPDSSVWDDG